MTNECKCCGRVADLRMGFCWECVECESVLASGVDMFDEAPPKLEGMSQTMSNLKYILNKYNVTTTR